MPVATRASSQPRARDLDTRGIVMSALVLAVVGAVLVVDRGLDNPETTAPPPPPRVVAPSDFCAAFVQLAAATQTQATNPSPAAVEYLKNTASTVGDLAQDTEMTPEAHAGIVYVVSRLLSLDDDASAEDLAAADDAATVTDDAHANAFIEYLQTNCV